MKNQVQLITYVDRLTGGGLRDMRELLAGPLEGVFSGVHLLPFFFPIDGADAGFDAADHTLVDPKLGTWEDVRALGGGIEIMADLIVNHVSTASPQFEDYLLLGDRSRYAELFRSYSRVFPEGADESTLLRIYRPRPGLPFIQVRFADGSQRLLWTTFTPQQIDIDVTSTAGKAYLTRILDQFHQAGIRAIRLDAAGYAIKKAGTSSFMIPETFGFISEFTWQAHARGIEVLVEVHSYYRDQVEIARHVDRVYDFALPPLVLHSLYTRDGSALKEWLSISPRNAVTVLDTHDGIGVIDVGADAKDPAGRPGLLAPAQIDALVETIHERSRGESRQATGAAASNLDLYQVNCTFYDALGRDDTAYWIARALQFFAPGIPQVYYVGLLAGSNDMQLLSTSHVGRDINRHHYSRDEVCAALERPIVQRILELIRLRNTHPAFQGEFQVENTPAEMAALSWRSGSDWARLEVNFAVPAATITYSSREGTHAMGPNR